MLLTMRPTSERGGATIPSRRETTHYLQN